jgi:amino acid permease
MVLKKLFPGIEAGMTESPKKLTFFEAASIITGYGIGGGIMAMPYLASFTGVVPMVLILLAAYFLSLLLHLMAAEIMLRDGESRQIIELFGKYLFRGRLAGVITWLVFSMIVAAFIASLSAYIAGGGEILRELLGIPVWIGHCFTYAIAAGVVFFGLKVLGMSEKYAVIAIVLLILSLALASLRLPYALPLFAQGHSNASLALFGMSMFSFFALFSVPQVVQGLSWNKRLIPRAIATGMAINGIVTLILVLISIGVTKEVTRIAIIGLGQALGSWANGIGSLFILLAMLTSYWSVSFALAVAVQERLGWGHRVSWLMATLPSFIIVIAQVSDFLGFMRIAGGAIAVLVAIMIVPLLNATRRHGPVKNPEWSMGVWGKPAFQILVVLAFLLMAAGSLVTIS